MVGKFKAVASSWNNRWMGLFEHGMRKSSYSNGARNDGQNRENWRGDICSKWGCVQVRYNGVPISRKLGMTMTRQSLNMSKWVQACLTEESFYVTIPSSVFLALECRSCPHAPQSSMNTSSSAICGLGHDSWLNIYPSAKSVNGSGNFSKQGAC